MDITFYQRPDLQIKVYPSDYGFQAELNLLMFCKMSKCFYIIPQFGHYIFCPINNLVRICKNILKNTKIANIQNVFF